MKDEEEIEAIETLCDVLKHVVDTLMLCHMHFKGEDLPGDVETPIEELVEKTLHFVSSTAEQALETLEKKEEI